MSDQQPLSLKETFDIYNSTLRLVGAANATGAIAAGAAFQAFEKIPGAQPYIKNVVLVFLFGVLLFTFSSATLFIAQSELDRYFAASRTKERADWEKIISGITKPPETHLRDAKKNWIVALLTFSMAFHLARWMLAGRPARPSLCGAQAKRSFIQFSAIPTMTRRSLLAATKTP